VVPRPSSDDDVSRCQREDGGGVRRRPLEPRINGVENMLYLLSRSTNDGRLVIDITFEVGTDLDMAQVSSRTGCRSRSEAAR